MEDFSVQPVYHATLIPHTHWDRAWYVGFQEFRTRLVRLVDRLLRILEQDPDYPVYMLDGQMAVLEDYLEVRPERYETLRGFIRQGRIKVGPWYVLADEFLVSPEALIRNMMLGLRMGEAYGGAMKIGYVPDGFGHIAQLPQILRGFGIDNAFFWRGLGDEGERLGTEFTWKSPDGSVVTTIWMPHGYHNISNLGYPIHWGDISQMEFNQALALEQIKRAAQALQPRTHTKTLLLMNGIDHAEPEPRLPEIITAARQVIPELHLAAGTLEGHLQQVRQAGKELPEFTGEFRWGRYSEVLQGVYSTRIGLKQGNQRVEGLLERYVEPLTALAWALGGDVPEGVPDLLGTAWRWLLKNHPHDDIYGSGIDLAHAEMAYRFSQAEQIGQVLVRDSLRQISRQVDFSAQPGIPILVFNPLGWERREMVLAEIDFEADDPTAQSFEVLDSSGKALPCQVLADEQLFWMETLKANRKRRVKVAFQAQVPACGYRTYYILPESPSPVAGQAQGSTSQPERLLVFENGAENEYLRFSINPDGTLDVFDKTSGASYSGLGAFIDVEDAGDEYSYSPCAQSQTLTTRGCQAQITRLMAGPNLATFRVELVFRLPEGLSDDRQHRSEKLVDVPIVSEITLYRGQPGIYIHTTLENRACDHKLSVTFPSVVNPRSAWVDGAFAVLERPIELPQSQGWVEDPTPLMHQRLFTDLSAGDRGLAILNRGLPAVEVLRGEASAEIWLTLLRCVGWLSRDDLPVRRVAAGPLVPTPGAQCLGRQQFEYAIFPHAGDWRQASPWAQAYNAPLLGQRADTDEGLNLNEMNITRDDPAQVIAIPWRREGVYADALSLVQLEPMSLVLSALKRHNKSESLVVRFYNREREAQVAHLRFGIALSAIYRLNLNEERQGEALTLSPDGHLELSVRPAEVVTLELVVDSQ